MSIPAVVYVEVDIPYCALTYGVAPCSAVLGVTGDRKCFNSLNTCQVREDFTDVPVTLRFSENSKHYPADIDAIQSLVSVDYSPATISLGENLGQRASLSVTFRDGRHSDTGPGFDKYWSERPYDPYWSGTFWGKFRARQPFLRGRAIRLIQGEAGQSLAEMQTRNFLIESIQGPTPDGIFTIIAKDALKFADGDRSQAPRLSNGFLNSPIDLDDTSITLSPAGIGDLEYPASGFAAIGGKEIVSFTRSGNTLTIVRGQFNTEAVAHAAQDRVQLCLVYAAEPPEDILQDLFVNYAGIPSGYIPIASWAAETTAKLGQVYSACIAEPTGVEKLASEIVKVAGLYVWWDELAGQIRLRVLGAVDTEAALIDQTSTLQDSFGVSDQPERRVSQVWTYYGQINPLKKVEDADNYRSAALMADLEAETDYGTPAIMKIFARWIADLGRTPALRVCALQLGRFRDPPRRIAFSLARGGAISPALGDGYQIQSLCLQQDTGEPATVPIQVTKVKPLPGHYEVEAQEALFENIGDFNPNERSIIVDGNRFNIILRASHDLLYPAPVSGNIVNLIIEENVVVGSTSTSAPAVDIGSWPTGVIINVTNNGRIQGAGGKGGNGKTEISAAQDGSPGGIALKTTVPINYTDGGGETLGGGGGGGGGSGSGVNNAGGGGGAGTLPGAAGTSYAAADPASPGTADAGGAGGDAGVRDGGDGGDPGDPGASGLIGASSVDPGAGGAPGAAIDGISLVTTIGAPGDRRGPTIN